MTIIYMEFPNEKRDSLNKSLLQVWIGGVFFNRWSHATLRHRRRLTGVWGRNPSAVKIMLTESVKSTLIYVHLRFRFSRYEQSFIDLKQIIKIFPGFTASAVFLIIWTSRSPILDHILFNSLLKITAAIFALPIFTVFIRQILNEFFGEEILDRDDVFL